MEYMTALGRCGKCGQDKIQVEGTIKCLNCDNENTGGSGLVVRVADPGDELMNKLLAKAGVAEVVGGKPPEPLRPSGAEKKAVISAQIEAKVVPCGRALGSIDQALDILRALPMPKDVKQFKAINKAIKILEDLGA